MFSEPPADLVQDKAHEGLRTRQVRGRDDQVERKRPVAGHKVLDPEIAPRRHFRDDRVAVERQEAQRGGQHAGKLVLRLVHQLTRRLGNNGMNLGRFACAKVICPEHDRQRRAERPVGIDKETRYTRQCLLPLGVKDMQDDADE